MKEITSNVKTATREMETEVQAGGMDSRLAHLIEAKQSILLQSILLNRRLRKRIAETKSSDRR